MPKYPMKYQMAMVARDKAPSVLAQKYKYVEPHFTYLATVKSGTGYSNTPPKQNPIIRDWMEKECISAEPYGYAKGNMETSFNATSKYARSNPKYNEESFIKAWRMVAQRWSIIKKSRLAADYTMWMDMQTSPGYPYSLKHQTKEQALQDPDVVAICNHNFENFYFNGLWTCRCKKEPKKWEKIKAHATRTILASPMDVQAPALRLFAEQNQLIYQAARQMRVPCTVGNTKYYLGQQYLYQRMTRLGKFRYGLELDFSEFDGSCTDREMTQVMNLRYGWLVPELQTPQIQRAISEYYREVIHTKIVMDTGEVYQKHTGNPSGQINTIVDNSLINEARWYYAWCETMPEKYHNIHSFMQYAELVTCGDDSMISVSDEVRHMFLPEKILFVFTQMGWKPKFGLDGYQPIHKLSYCSQHFKWVNGYVVPVPNNYEKLLASLLYGGDNRGVRETLTRLLGVKIESYFLTAFRTHLDVLISELFEKYYIELQRPPTKDELSLGELLILNKDVTAAYGLYLHSFEKETPHTFRGPIQYFDDKHIRDTHGG